MNNLKKVSLRDLRVKRKEKGPSINKRRRSNNVVGHAPSGCSHRVVYLVAGDARVVGTAGGQHARVLRDDGARGAGAALRGRAGAAPLPRRVAQRPRAGARPPPPGAVRGRARAAAAAARRAAQRAPSHAHQQASHAPAALRDSQPDDVASFALQPTLRCAPNW